MDNSKAFSSLYEIILDVSTHLGFCVIPLTGKRPPKGFEFSKYQTQRPNSADLCNWFNTDRYTSYGVVCGSVSSNLFVLDFDCEAAYLAFSQLFPALALSYTVKTRRGYHVYLRAEEALRPRKIEGGDLLAQGSLVVGVGSCVNDFRYTITINAPILRLNAHTLSHLFAWASPADTQHDKTQTQSAETISHLINQYSVQAPVLGRNNALYKAALSAAHTGFNQTETLGALAALHVTTRACKPHPPESARARLQEAQATIKSAYEATSKQRHKACSNTSKGLPNALREGLIRMQHSTSAARLLDIFALSEWLPGRVFSTSEAVSLAAEYGLGRCSVLEVLSGKHSQLNEQKIIPRAEQDNAYSHSHDNTPPAGDRDNGRLNSRGRRTNYYLVPDVPFLCRICQINPDQRGSIDTLTAHDMSSEKAYRMALHREFVQRVSPELSYRWHAQRLNVSARTVRRYNKELGVIVTPIFGYVPLTWAALERDDLWGIVRKNTNERAITPGRWLQTSAGKRYPAIKGVARKLLKARVELIVCKRMPSRFQLLRADHPRVLYSCIWRRLDADTPDWGGGEYDDPREKRIIFDPILEADPADDLSTHADEALLEFINGYMALPQDLTLLKGIGKWYETILNKAGITRYKQLADADPVHIARLSGLKHYVTPRQAAFWIDQARVLVTRLVSADELQTWVYKDWCNYDFERKRIESASPTLRRALAREFCDKGWLKYHGSLPASFREMIDT